MIVLLENERESIFAEVQHIEVGVVEIKINDD